MTDDRIASLLWGVIGGLSFLVLIQGYELLVGPPVDALLKATITVGVGLVSTGATALLQPRIPSQNR